MVCVLLGMLLWDSSSSPWQPSTGSASASPSASASASASAVTSELPTARSRAQKQGLCGHETASSSSISQESGAELNPSEDFIRAFIECKGEIVSSYCSLKWYYENASFKYRPSLFSSRFMSPFWLGFFAFVFVFSFIIYFLI